MQEIVSNIGLGNTSVMSMHGVALAAVSDCPQAEAVRTFAKLGNSGGSSQNLERDLHRWIHNLHGTFPKYIIHRCKLGRLAWSGPRQWKTIRRNREASNNVVPRRGEARFFSTTALRVQDHQSEQLAMSTRVPKPYEEESACSRNKSVSAVLRTYLFCGPSSSVKNKSMPHLFRRNVRLSCKTSI
jgi:hypothetical protein